MLPAAIDVHGHFTTPTYREAMAKAGVLHPDGHSHVPDWEAEDALDLMDRLGIAASLLAISSPGINVGDQAAAIELARAVNEEGAAVVRAEPARFGLFAVLPLPDVDASLRELAYALDELHADGIALLTNVCGNYLGDPSYEPLMAELDRRSTVVVLHPTSPAGWEQIAFGRPRPMVEFPIDTTRTVFHMILSGVIERYPRIRYVIPHSGGALPILADRVHDVTAISFRSAAGAPDVIAALRGLHYDLAGPALPRALPALLALVEPSQLLYGTDFPYPPSATIERFSRALEETDVLDDQTRLAALRENALALFPRLASVSFPT
jgi:predicted TIM-barrel fold metal-dependent hydrolase